MMSLVEYFVRHYTLVIDNTQETYWPATEAGKDVVRESGITRQEWEALSTAERGRRFADDIGQRITDLIDEWTDEALSTPDHPGALIFREILITSDSEIRYALGEHYTPEDSDIVDLLDDSVSEVQ